MIANLAVAFSGLMGFLTIFLILIRYRSNRITNIYLVIIFGIVSTRMVVIGTFNLENNDVITTLLEKYNNLLIVIIPCTYLYFLNLVHDKKRIELNNLKHFSIPLLFNLIDYALDNSYLSLVKNNFYYYIFFALYTIVYLVLNYNLLNKNIWNRKGDISIVVKQNQLIKNWSVFLFSIFLVNALRTIVVLFWEINNQNYSFGASFLWITAILWLSIYFKIIISPEILYGYTFLNSKINENNKSDKPILSFWTTKTIIEITNIQDKQLNDKIKEAIPEYIKLIDQFSFHNQTFRNKGFVISDLSNKLNIPKSHLNFLFKYHSKISFSEYKKIVRIHDSLALINEGYLTTNTFDSLAKEVGFKSYNTFFVSFKDYTGVTPQEFLIKIIKNKINL
jgi:AraC-like DNA-binding protein